MFLQVIVEIQVFRDHKQIIKYIPPTDPSLFHNADLIAIDEAAAIPLPNIKEIIKHSKVRFLSFFFLSILPFLTFFFSSGPSSLLSHTLPYLTLPYLTLP